MYIGSLPLYKIISISISISLLSCCLPCSFANKQDGSSALSDQELSDRLGLEQLVDQAVIEQCQVVGATCMHVYVCAYVRMNACAYRAMTSV